jgi:hypothetical protein
MTTLRTRTKVATAMAIFVLIIASLAVSSQGTAAHAGGCAPVAKVPTVDQSVHRGYAHAVVPCAGSSYSVSLVNAAGTTLGSPATGTTNNSNQAVQTSNIACAGAYVHTFIWINIGGVVMSDTSGDVLC